MLSRCAGVANLCRQSSPVLSVVLLYARGMSDKKTKKIDAYVGARIRALRGVRGVRQNDLAKKIGVRLQQCQKYETGANRVSASRRW